MKKPAEIQLQLLFNDLLDEYTDNEHIDLEITVRLPLELINFISAYNKPDMKEYDRMRAAAVIGDIMVEGIRSMRKNPLLWNLDDEL